MYRILILIFLFFTPCLFGQETSTSWLKKLDNYKLQPIIGFQLWSTYTHGAEVYNEATNRYQSVDDRFNTQLHRSRLGIKGQPYKNIQFNITTALDFVGRDILSGTQGGSNNGASPTFRIWNAIVQWKVLDQSDGLHVTTGYMIPQIGRESITPALRVSSMEKSWSQNYLRRQLVGVGPGRTMGINLGGMFRGAHTKLGFSYDVGIFNPAYQSFDANSAGEKYAPLLVGRFVVHLGDPETESYALAHKVNYFGQRKGLSVALAGAVQGETNNFERQHVIGLDWLFNWAQFNLNGEWTFMQRQGIVLVNRTVTDITIDSNTGFVRLSYNLSLKNGKVLEPVLMIVQFNGALEHEAQGRASSLGAFAGEDYSYDLGVNYYISPDLKLSLHYTWYEADAGDAPDGTTINNYFVQSEAGAIRRGDWLGLGLVAIF